MFEVNLSRDRFLIFSEFQIKNTKFGIHLHNLESPY